MIDIYAADFETITSPDDCRVWAWAIADIYTPENVIIGNTIENFIAYISTLRSPTIYFHNLKFDGMFILDYLLRHNYTYNKSKHIEENQFNTLISETGTWYSIRLKLQYEIEFRDSLKIIPLPIEKVAKTFHLPESKLTLDYNTFREYGHELTEHEIEYIKADVVILAKALNEMITNGFSRLTAGSNALNHYKNMTEEYKRLFPQLEEKVDIDCRKSYKGGWTYLNPLYRNKPVEYGCVYDVNSMYPWAMKYCKLPFGKPVLFTGEPKPSSIYDLFIVEIECEFELKEGKYPSIQLKHSMFYNETEYITKSVDLTTLHLTSVDLKLFFECYNVTNLTYIGGYMFKSKEGMFADYVDEWFEKKTKAKEEGNPGMTLIAKLMLNSLYGKFGARLEGKSKIPYLSEKDQVAFKKSELEKRKPGYVPVATFITSYCRDKIIRAANKCGDRFIYADTDSLHINGLEEPDIDIDKFRLGAFDCESKFKRAKFIRQKTYMEISDSVDVNGNKIEAMDIKCAGMPRKVKDKVKEEDFKEGMIFDGKLLPQIVPGGVILKETTFEIKKLKKEV